jgi:CheY-like chemotaxis protein
MTETGWGPMGIESSSDRGESVPWGRDSGADGKGLDDRAPMRRPSGWRLLVADDEAIVREAARVILPELGYEVICVGDGREAVERYRECRGEIDLVIVDLTMPVMGGAECFRALREIDPGVRVLLSTGHALEGEARTLLREGVVGFVQKPYTMRQLAVKVREVLASAKD